MSTWCYCHFHIVLLSPHLFPDCREQKVHLVFYCFFVKPSLVLYFAVFVRIEQIVVKVKLKNTTNHRIKVLHPIFYHPYIDKIALFEFVAESLDKIKKKIDKFLQAFRLNLISKRVILLSVLVICSAPNKIFSITFLRPVWWNFLGHQDQQNRRRKCQFWFNIKYATPMSTAFFRPVSVSYDKWIFSLFCDIIAAWLMNWFI